MYSNRKLGYHSVSTSPLCFEGSDEITRTHRRSLTFDLAQFHLDASSDSSQLKKTGKKKSIHIRHPFCLSFFVSSCLPLLLSISLFFSLPFLHSLLSLSLSLTLPSSPLVCEVHPDKEKSSIFNKHMIEILNVLPE